MKRMVICLFLGFLLSVLSPGSGLAQALRIGVLIPLSGKLAGFGEVSQKSFLMALEKINGSGGIGGRPLDLIIEDSASQASVGRKAMEKLITRDKVVAVAGGFSSSVTFEAASLAQQHRVPFLVTTASADKITEMGREYIFRLTTPVSEYERPLISFLERVAKPENVGVIYERGPFGAFGLKRLYKVRKKTGIRLVRKDAFEPGTLDFRPLLEDVKARNPELIYIISRMEEGALLLTQAAELGLKPKLFLGGTAAFTRIEMLDRAQLALEHVFCLSLWLPSAPYPGARHYAVKYAARYDTYPDYHGAQAYAAMEVLADALKRAAIPSPQGVRETLAQTDMDTVFGPVRFSAYEDKTRQNPHPALLGQWIEGDLETVWPRALASCPFVFPLPD